MKKGIKKVLSVILSMVMVVGLIGIVNPKQVEASQNDLVENGTFDNSDGSIKLDGWNLEASQEKAVMETKTLFADDFESGTSNWSIASNGTLETETSGVNDGKGMKLNVTGSNPYVYRAGFTFEAGKTYTASMWIKTDTPSAYAWFVLENIKWDYKALNPTTEWTKVTIPITVDTTTTTQVGIQFVSSTGSMFVDDFSITWEEESVIDTAVFADDFESGTSNWSVTGNGSLETETSGINDGNGMKMNVTGSNPYVYRAGFTFEAGKTYTASMWIKTDTPSAYAWFVLENIKWDYKALNPTTEWTKVTIPITVDTTTTTQVGIQFVSSTGSMSVDDFSITYEEVKKENTTGVGAFGAESTNGALLVDASAETAVTVSDKKSYAYSFQLKGEEGAKVTVKLGEQTVKEVSVNKLTEGWNTISGIYTATADATKLSFTSEGRIYLDNIALYDVDANRPSIEITATNAYPDSANSWYIEIDDIEKATSSFYYMTIKVDGELRKVAVEKAGGKLVIWEDFFHREEYGYESGTNHPLESVVIPAGTVLYPIDPDNTGWTAGIDADRLQITNKVEAYKLGLGWGMVKDTHDTSATPQYYNIDNGTKYEVTTSANAYDIKKNGVDIDTTTLDTVGTYDITRIEKDTKFVQKVVLYKNGDANGDGVVDSKDLVALKKSVGGAGTGSAGAYAADMNRSGNVDDTDARGLRYSIANAKTVNTDGTITHEIQVSKGESTLNGVMPIVGFDGPDYDKDRTGHKDFITEEIYNMVADLGINTVVANRNEIGTDYDKSSKQLQLAEERGIKVYLNDGYVHDESNLDGITLSENLEKRLSEITAKYDGYSSFAGYDIIDEPMYNAVHNNKKSLDDVDTPLGKLKEYTNINSYLNLFPYICGPLNGQLGGISTKATTYDSYTTYVEKASTSGAQELVYDMYLRGNGVTSGSWIFETTKYKIHTEDFYINLDWMRNIAAGQGKPFQAFVQVGVDFDKENTKKTELSKLPTVQEMYLEANAALAMGAKGINYYSLVQPLSFAKNTDGTYDYYRSGLINAKGEANNGASGSGANYKYYNAAKKINAYIAKIDEVLMHATSKAVIATDKATAGYLEKTRPVASYGSLSSVTGTKALVGCFDYYGKEAYMVVNTTPDEGSAGSLQAITLNFDGKQSYTCTNMACEETPGSGNSLALTVGAGEAVLVVLD